MRTTLLLVAILSTAACSKKDNKNEAPAAGAKPTTPTATPAAPATPAVAAMPGGMPCDKIVPKDLGEKYFKQHKLENGIAGLDYAGKCKVEPIEDKPDGKPHSGEINVQCHDNNKSAKAPTIEGLKKAFKDMKPIDGVTDSIAMQSDGGWQFNAWDSDSNCMVNGILPEGVDGPAFVKDWLAVLPPK